MTNQADLFVEGWARALLKQGRQPNEIFEALGKDPYVVAEIGDLEELKLRLIAVWHS
ncbi:hypothetical protein [Rhodovulum steppense]|uniref:hypothetical protein n=1 Tax=Rhodovulum steppense TaxID=540251 RepID=UPI0014052BBD|nr:hypothetical protein [Rhodovulum steppense]